MSVTIYHNPNCGTSRNTLEMIRASGVEPEVIEYLQAGWTEDLLRSLSKLIGVPLKALLRESGTPAEELGLLSDEVSEASLLKAMIIHPILVNRPIVVSDKGANLCRPSELVLQLLDSSVEAFTKEDGEVVGNHRRQL